MLAIVHFFIDLTLLRRAPQDLPASQALLGVVVLAALCASLLLSGSAGVGIGLGLLQAVLDLALMLGALYVALNWLKRAPRFLQTGTALVGADTLIGLLALLPLGLVGATAEDSSAFALGALLFLGLVVWSVLVAGHILRHAVGVSLLQGAGIAIGYKLLALMLIGAITGTGSGTGVDTGAG